MFPTDCELFLRVINFGKLSIAEFNIQHIIGALMLQLEVMMINIDVLNCD